MALNRDKAEGRPALPPIEAGTHAVRLCRVYDLGVQMGEWKGVKKRANQIYLVFEFMDHFLSKEDGSPNTDLPRVSGKFIKLYPKADKGVEYDFCKALDPAGKYNGDWGSMVRDRLPALATTSVNERGRDQIDTLAGIPKGFNVAPGKVEVQVFDLDNPDKELWATMPEFIKTKISERIRDESVPPIKYDRTEAQAKVTVQEPVLESESADHNDLTDEDVPW
jgi:hypothetical protein